MMNIALVAIGGFFGAITRFSISNWMKSKTSFAFPIATLTVNLIGSFLLGIIIGSNLERTWSLLLGTGFMGAFTTFSTFKFESITLLSKKRWITSFLYLGGSYTFGILLAFVGIKIGIRI